jgi:predicted nucleotide-binding protein
VLLAGDYCILPPFFVLQSDAVRRSIEIKGTLITAGAIRIPLRESSLEAFFAKKMEEYEPVRHLYRGLYDRDGQVFLIDSAASLIKRTVTVGRRIANAWEAGPDESTAWAPLRQALTSAELETLRRAPLSLKDRGESVTWPGLAPLLPTAMTRVEFEINQALQHEYSRIYLDEYDATILTSAPPKTTELLLPGSGMSYDYAAFAQTCSAVRIWQLVQDLSANGILGLKYHRGFLNFLTAYDDICDRATSRLEVAHVFANCYGEVREREKSSLLRLFERVRLRIRIQWYPEAVEVIGNLLYNVAEVARKRDSIRPRSYWPGSQPTEDTRVKVFVVHGRNHGVRDQIRLFLIEKGLNPVVMETAAMSGRTLVEKFEELAAECAYSIVIATADDDLVDQKTGKSVKRLRQNVVLEIGFFWGRNGRRGKFSVLLEPDPILDLPSDLSGLGYIEITPDLAQTKMKLEADLRHAGVLAAA